MPASSLKQDALVMLMGTALAGCALVAGVGSVSAVQLSVAHRPALSTAAQQTLAAILAGTPPYEQRLVLNAVRALGLERAEAQLSQLQAMPAAARQATGQLVTQILRALPPQYHQAFIDGLFEVSAQEEQFVMQVVNYIRMQVARQGEATQMISDFGRFGRGLQSQAWQQSQDFLGQQAQGMSGALGPFTQFGDPSSGWQGEGYTAPIGMQTYRCPESSTLISSNGSPHYGCVQVYTR